jgi:hypothetical protein
LTARVRQRIPLCGPNEKTFCQMEAARCVRTAISAHAGLVATMRTLDDNGRFRLAAGVAVNAVEAAAIDVTRSPR